ncbi:hypothetical protein MMC18_003424 [Xylographa bjoerkii]|nr:hypothetical protein [Xylographa bjoerkii]
MASGKSIGKSSNVAKLRDRPISRNLKKRSAKDIQTNDSQTNDGPTVELQQSLLNVLKDSLSERFNGSLASSIQAVKGHLFKREFSKAFGSDDLLEAYAVRWSPSRALAYMDLICGLPQLSGLLKGASYDNTMADRLRSLSLDNSSSGRGRYVNVDTAASSAASIEGDHPSKNKIVTCLGGGAGAEIMALAGCWHYLGAPSNGGAVPTEHSESTRSSSTVLTIRVVDMANWTSVVEKLYQGITTIPSVSKYASGKTRICNAPLNYSDYFEVAFDQRDILDLEVEPLTIALQNSSLVTLTFTLNELYSASISKTTDWLLTLTYLTEPGTLLLIVDSPGSYSTVKLSGASNGNMEGAEKRYPMKWLVDHTLLEASSIYNSKNTTQEPQWEKLASSDSTWFRLQDSLKYPLNLEDIRYQYHLYKRI